MATLKASDITKPVENIVPENLPDATHEHVANGLSAIVAHSANNHDVMHHIHAPIHNLANMHWVQKLIPGIEKLAVDYHCGNYVIKRGSSEPFFETMPLYARLGMHLLFYGKEQVKLLGNKKVEELLREQSVKQGHIFDDPKSVHSIPSFIETYAIPTDELLEQDLSKYKNFNEFFYRKLKPDARPVHKVEDQSVICSAADCRLTAYASVDAARTFWVKGQNFNIPNLLNLPATSPKVEPFHGASVAIFRLAPADYHRFHCPVDCTVGESHNVPGSFFTVNPQAINEPGFDVLTANTRSILYLTHKPTGKPIAFVAVGALLVGSIRWTGGAHEGTVLKRGDELGYFAYGGSTIVILFAKEVIEFDPDLVTNSGKPIETLLKVGYSIGKTPA